MSGARDLILQRLREAPRAQPEPPPDVAAYYTQRTGEKQAVGALVESFIRQARFWRAEVIETTASQCAEALAHVMREKAYLQVLAGRGTQISAMLAATLPGSALTWYDEGLQSRDFKAKLFGDIDVGITTAHGGIAETGSLILWPNAAEPRTLSLIPPAHIAVLHASRLHETWFDAVTSERWAQQMPTNIVLVTGPSKTADIQRLLVYGAHGPKELTILLIRDDGDAP